MAVQTILDPCRKRVNNVNNVCYKQGQFTGQTKILLITHLRQMVTIVIWSYSTQKRAHCLHTSCLTDGLDVPVKKEVCVPQPETLIAGLP